MLNLWDRRHHDADRPLVIAHRGASVRAVENTREALELALELGADGVEIDVRLTGDGVAVLVHDADLRRLAGSPLVVAEASLAELRQAYPDIISLDEALDILPDHPVMLDIKPKSQEELAPLYAALRAHHAHRGLMIGVESQEQWDAAVRHAPQRPMIGLLGDDWGHAFVAAGGRWLRFTNRPDQAELIDGARGRGVAVMIVTGHRDHAHTLDPAVIAASVRLAPDAVLLDDPTLALRALATPQ